MHYLNQLTPDHSVRADYILDTLALCIAAVLEHDTHITAPKHTRMALDTVDVLVKRWARSLRENRAAPDVSFLSAILQRWYAAQEAVAEDRSDEPA